MGEWMQFGVHEKPVHSGGYMTRQQCITKGHDGGIWSLVKWMAKNTWNFYAFVTFLENLCLIRRFWKWTLCDITRWTNQEAVNRGLSELWSPRREEHQGGTSNVDPLIGLQQCVGKWEKENQSLHKLRSWGSRAANWNNCYEPATDGRLFHDSEEDTWSPNQLWPRERDGQPMWGGELQVCSPITLCGETQSSRSHLRTAAGETLTAELLQARQRKQRGQRRVKRDMKRENSLSINICSRNQEWAVSQR